MYCQKCGRKLKSGMRFCDYCGQPVGGGSRTGRTASPQTKRTATATRGASSTASRRSDSEMSKNRAQYERNKKRRELERKKAQKNRRIALISILIAIVAAIAIGFLGYSWIAGDSGDKNNNAQKSGSSNEIIETTETASSEKDDEEEEKEEKKSEKETEKEKDKEKENENEKNPYAETAKDFNVLKDDTMDEISCVYPKSFTKEAKRANDAVWSGSDENGDGTVIIYSKHVGTSKQGSKLLTEYEKGLGADKITDKESTPDSYYITFERNGKMTHRKAILADGMCIYYDFSYPKGSDNTSSYKKYIEYMDYYLDEELKLFKKDSEKKN